ncbi:MAG: TAXI family TRAP transporter solute-binding subunit [Pirellulaceae bacterium]|jgi:TRAP transporter TAXI family solute receptor|nr:TAXI family TRAP transporter solute-binding subunit [Pirellulaceae bacterium]
MLARWGPALLIALVALAATPWLIGPRCPQRLVIATGSEQGAYYHFANRYREILAREGIALEVRSTGGSVQNSRLLAAGDADISLAMIQGGTAADQAANLESLASLYLEPVWVFCAADRPVDGLDQLSGKRIAIGPDGSGTQAIALKLLGDNGMSNETPDSAELLDWTTAEAVAGLKSGSLDAAFFVISPESPIVRDLLQTDGIQLMNFQRAAAYQRKYSYLSSVTLPAGLIDLQRNIPSRDIVLLAPAANLVARSDLHHALVPLLMQTVNEVHESAGLLAEPVPLPSPDFVDFPINKHAREYFRAGPSLFYRHLPFWLAAWLDRVKLMLLPMCTLLIPLLKVAPPIYRWRIRSKIYRWYRVLRQVDQKLKDAEPGTDFDQDIENLKVLETELAQVSVPLSYMAEFYNLHLHISFVLERLHQQRALSAEDNRSRLAA